MQNIFKLTYVFSKAISPSSRAVSEIIKYYLNSRSIETSKLVRKIVLYLTFNILLLFLFVTLHLSHIISKMIWHFYTLFIFSNYLLKLNLLKRSNAGLCSAKADYKRKLRIRVSDNECLKIG